MTREDEKRLSELLAKLLVDVAILKKEMEELKALQKELGT